MKLRKHITFILIILIFLISGLYSIGVMVKEHNTNLKAYETRIHECEMSGNNDSYCEEVLNSKKPTWNDSFTVLSEVLNRFNFITYIAPLLIIIISLNNFLYKLKNGTIKNYLTRIDYKDFILKEWFSSLKFVFIIPLYITFLFLIILLITHNLDYSSANSDAFWFNFSFFNNIALWIFVFMINMIFQSIFWINLGFICSFNSKNIPLTYITSFLTYLAIWAFLEIVIGQFVGVFLFNNSLIYEYVSLPTIWNYVGVDNLLVFTLIQFFLAFISFIVFLCIYKNKEKVLINNET